MAKNPSTVDAKAMSTEEGIQHSWYAGTDVEWVPTSLNTKEIRLPGWVAES